MSSEEPVTANKNKVSDDVPQRRTISPYDLHANDNPLTKIWIIDTGATSHMTGDYNSLVDTHDIPGCWIRLPDGKRVAATTAGSTRLNESVTLNDVLFVPDLNCSLLSVSQLIKETNVLVKFDGGLCMLQDRITTQVIGVGRLCDGLYYFQQAVDGSALTTIKECSFDLWHRRLGHPSSKVLSLFPLGNNSRASVLNKEPCSICLRAKQSRASFPLSINKTTHLFELVHIDVWGPYRTPSMDGFKFFLTIVDDYSRGTWVYLMRAKSEVPTIFRQFCAMVSRQFDTKLKKVRSDNGTEFECLDPYFREQGILHECSCRATPQQNCRVERKHQHILNVARALRFQGFLPIEFWGECILTAAYLINRTPSNLLNGKTPHEMMFGHIPEVSHIRVFGCLCYVHNQERHGDKFEARSKTGVFMGYPFGKKGWRVYCRDTGKFLVSRDVIFCENVFPFQDIASGSNSIIAPEFSYVDDDVDSRPREQSQGSLASAPISVPANISPKGGLVTSIHDERSSSENGSPHDKLSSSPNVSSMELEDQPSATQPAPTQQPSEPSLDANLMGRGHRMKTSNVRLQDYVTYTVVKDGALCKYPLTDFIGYARFSDHHRTFLAEVDSSSEPQTYQDAVKCPSWRKAMAEEINALENNGTWDLVSLPHHKKALGCKWVYRIKRKSDGSIERFKARLVVHGNRQVEGIDYNETFAPVVKLTTVRVLLAVAAVRNWELHQMDVHNAFLHGDLSEEVYMKLPPGFRPQAPNMVCKLQKSLYGLKQAPRCWFAKLSGALRRYGFTQSHSDYSLFSYSRAGSIVHVLVYVDDLVIAGDNSSEITRFKKYLSDCFHMKDLGTLKYFLGIEVARNATGIFLSQRKYALDIITETGLLGCRPLGAPLEPNHKLALSSGSLLTDPSSYRCLVGRLVYLSVTRPDLSYAVHTLAQFLQNPRTDHWNAALGVVRYLKGTPGHGILLRTNSSLQLTGWCDSDWAACPLTRRSLTGWFVQLGVSPVSWKTKKQPTVARSSAEAEYRSMAVLTCELKWLRGLLRFLGVPHPTPMKIYCDSTAALHIAANPVFHERTKHIEIDCHFVRDELLRGSICTSHVSTHNQCADILTKALGKGRFDTLLPKLGICLLHAPT